MPVTPITRVKPTPTITIPVTAAWHLVIGAVLAFAAAGAFWTHFELDPTNTYRGTAAVVGVVAACAALAYWLWCAIQCLRTDTASIRETVSDDHEAIRDDIARLEGAITALQDCYLEHGEPPRRASAKALPWRDAA